MFAKKEQVELDFFRYKIKGLKKLIGWLINFSEKKTLFSKDSQIFYFNKKKIRYTYNLENKKGSKLNFQKKQK